MPLTLRVNVGDCVKVQFEEQDEGEQGVLLGHRIGVRSEGFDGRQRRQQPRRSDDRSGGERTYTYYADPFNGETTSLVWDWGNVMTNPRNGLFGAVVVGPKGSKYRDPKTGADLSNKNAWVADVIIDRTIPGNEMPAELP